jgi:hypothetical protein
MPRQACIQAKSERQRMRCKPTDQARRRGWPPSGGRRRPNPECRQQGRPQRRGRRSVVTAAWRGEEGQTFCAFQTVASDADRLEDLMLSCGGVLGRWNRTCAHGADIIRSVKVMTSSARRPFRVVQGTSGTRFGARTPDWRDPQRAVEHSPVPAGHSDVCGGRWLCQPNAGGDPPARYDCQIRLPDTTRLSPMFPLCSCIWSKTASSRIRAGTPLTTKSSMCCASPYRAAADCPEWRTCS